MDFTKVNRMCIINNDEGYVTVTFKVSEGMMAGAEFKLYKPDDNEPVFTWKMASKDTSKAIFTIKLLPHEIHRNVMTWQVLLCSLDASKFKGAVLVTLSQKGVACKFNIPTLKEFDNVPPCQINKTDKFTQSMMFVVKSS